MSKKIIFALSSFFPYNRAGTETYVLNLAKELIKLGYKTSVIIPSVGKDSEEYQYDGIKVYSFSVPLKVSAKEMNGLEKPSGIDEFQNLLQKIKPDIFHLHSLSRSMHAEHLKIASKMGIKTVFTAHLGSTFCVKGDFLLFDKMQCNGLVCHKTCLACFINKKSDYSIAKSYISANFINRIILSTPLKRYFPAYNIVKYKLQQLANLTEYCNRNIAIAEWIKNAFRINGFNNIQTIPQGIDSYFTSKKKIIEVGKTIEIIFIGRMHPDKGIHLLIDALEFIQSKLVNLTVVTIPFKDEMNYYNEIKTRYVNLGFTSWFENLTKQQVAEKLDNANILVLPSTSNEAAPLVILEAFAKKVPIIGSEYIAIKEMIQHNINGLHFKNGSAKSLREQLEKIINEPNLITRFSNNIENVRTFEDVAKEHDILYRAL